MCQPCLGVARGLLICLNAVIPDCIPLTADSDSGSDSDSSTSRLLRQTRDSDLRNVESLLGRLAARLRRPIDFTLAADQDLESGASTHGVSRRIRQWNRKDLRNRRRLFTDSEPDSDSDSDIDRAKILGSSRKDRTRQGRRNGRANSESDSDENVAVPACPNLIAIGSDKSDETDDDVPVSKLQAMGYSTALIREVKARRKRLKKGKQAGSGTGGLCSNCNNITIDAIRSGFNISDSFNRLKKSSEICQLCRIVLMCLRNHLPEIDEKLENSTKKSSVAVKFNDEGGTDVGDLEWHTYKMPKVPLFETFQLSMSDSKKGIIQVSARISMAPGGKGKEGGLQLLDIHSYIMIYTKDANISTKWSLPLDPRPRMDCKHAMIRKWLEADLNRPENLLDSFISSADHEASFPRRLIYVPPSFDAEPSQLRLLNSEQLLKTKFQHGFAPYPKYITLSHRWGLIHHFTTTKANLSSREEGFALEDLPRTYRDAVTVASELGINYLWIDAACIVQDDPEEWLCESEKMGMIYRNAVCTIASHCSESDNDGFLEDAFRRSRGSVGFSLEKTFLRPAANLELDVSKSPLSKRGWILQERFLSTRVLHFTTGMIYLETGEGVKSEDGDVQETLMRMTMDSPNLLTAEQFLYRKPLSLQRFSNFLNETPTKQNDGDEINTSQSPLEWFSLLEMYTTCSLTKEEDKLTAISGIAKICSQKFDSAYLAGVWADRLATGLMWMNVGGPLKGSTSLRASSWAWSAYDGPIQFPLSRHQGSFTTTCRFLEIEARNPKWLNSSGALTIQVELLDLSPMVRSGDLIISRFRQALYPRSSKAWETGGADEPFRPPFIKLFDIFNVHQCSWAPFTFEAQRHQLDPNWMDCGWIAFDTENRRLSQEEYRMPLFFASLAYFSSPNPPFNGGPPLSMHMGIFLLPAGSDNTFWRIGAGIIRESLLARTTDFASQRITLI